MKDLETDIVTDLKEMYGLKDELARAIDDAIASGDTSKALELKELLEKRIKETEQRIDPYELNLRQDIAKEYGYLYVGAFSPEGVARAQLRSEQSWSRWVYTRRDGSKINDQNYSLAYPFKEARARVGLDHQIMAFILPNGENVSRPYDVIYDFSEGLAAVKGGRFWGYINKTDKLIIRAQFKDCYSFSENLAPVMIENWRWIYIDRLNINPTRKEYRTASQFREGLAMVTTQDGTVCYIDKGGEVVLQDNYKLASDFREGLALVAKEPQNYIFINHNGEVAINQPFSEATSFYEGLARVSVGPLNYFINHHGEKVIHLGDFNAGPFDEGVSHLYRGNEEYYIDHYGRRVFE